MNLCLICDSLVAGKSGVGDYTIALAKALIQQGHEVAVVSLADDLSTEGADVFPHLRLARQDSWESKGAALQSWLQKRTPDLLSLQYVPYSFNARGLPWRFSSWLQKCAGKAPFHILFHELWIAAEKESTLKNRLIGRLQKSIIQSMLSQLKPVAIHTTNEVYVELLRRLGHEANLLPLFSNITPLQCPAKPWPLYKKWGLNIDGSNRQDWLIAVVFGTVHPSWNATHAVSLLKKAAQIAEKKPALIFCGRSGKHGTTLNATLAQDTEIHSCLTGPLDQADLSAVMSESDLGLSASPWALAGKSGSFSALIAHGVPVVFTDDNWRLRNGHTPLPKKMEGAYLETDKLAPKIAQGLPRPTHYTSPEKVAEQLVRDIQPSVQSA